MTTAPSIARTGLSRLAGLLSLLAMLALLALPAAAQDAGALAKEAETKIRAAEKSMFAGKLEEAQSTLAEASTLIAKIREIDARHPRLRSLDSRCEKLRKDLERRTKRTPPEQKTPPPPGETDPGKLPAGVTKRLGEIDDVLAKFDAELARESKAGLAERADGLGRIVGQAKDLLGEITRQYGDKVPGDHPELMAAKQQIEAAEGKVAAMAEAAADADAAKAATIPPAAEIAADRELVESLKTRFLETMSLIHGNSLVYGPRVQDAVDALAQIEKVEKEVLPELQPALAKLAARYGTESMAIDNKLHEWKVPPRERFATALGQLIESAGKVAKSRTASAESVASHAKMMLETVDRLTPEIRVKRMEDVKAMLQIGQKLDTGNATINELLAGIDASTAEMAAKIEKEIDAKTWAGNAPGFPGPGEIDALAKTALEFFRQHPNWGRNPEPKVEVLALAIRGPWQVAERDIFSRVLSWRLPVHLAITKDALREKGLARVYELSIVTQQGAPDNTAKAPPFEGYWVGNNWMMRLEKLPDANK